MQSEFSIELVWNEKIGAEQENYETKPRPYISASKIGKSLHETWLYMKGTPVTNPYEERVIRKFQAGYVFEDIVRKILELTGLEVLNGNEERNKLRPIKIDGCLPVYGHYDILLRGAAPWDEARKRIEATPIPDALKRVGLGLVDFLSEKYPYVLGADGKTAVGLSPILYDVKSVNSMVFWNNEYLLDAYPEHKLQVYTYLRALRSQGINLDSFRILYISKDDLTVREFEVSVTPELERQWLDWVVAISEAYLNNREPEREPDIVFDEKKKRWDLNWKMERSLYLTHITGLEKEAWQQIWKDECSKRNRSLGSEKAKETRKMKKEALASKGEGA